ncbi:MAG: hypothetical protein KDA66_18055 [Planctomycetaceae bacterium]|nr:hypothetical protein [Planctomycetaceae bacterium]
MSTKEHGLNVNHAKTLANWYAEIGGDPAHASIYMDAVILYVCLSEESQSRMAAELSQEVLAFARSDDDFCGAIVVRPDHWMHCLDVASTFTELAITDNRQKDAHTVAGFVGLLLGGTRNG